MIQTVLITGATAGLGAEFARQLAARGSHLVLVARNAERLEAPAARLRTEYGVRVQTLAADLHTQAGVNDVVGRLEQTEEPVTALINNAGYGLARSFADNTVQTEMDHLHIHLTAPLTLAHAALQGMRARGAGRIINVASVAGFTARGSYAALKAAMISFSRWANMEYAPDGVTVTALCPGFVHTEFHQRMQVDKNAVPWWMWLNADDVVGQGLRDAAAGRAVSVPSVKYKVLVALAKVLPASFVAQAGAQRR